MRQRPYRSVLYAPTASGDPTFQDWMSQLSALEQNFVSDKIQDLRAGDWLNVVNIRENLYELRIQMRETLFLYFTADQQTETLTLLKGVKIPLAARVTP
jgi:putative component of toxin-antitoxin plasmid stabilization module